MARQLSGQVEIVPGVVGPELIQDSRVIPDRERTLMAEVNIAFSPGLGRYICSEFTARGAVTTEGLRHVRIGDWVNAALLRPTAASSEIPIREVVNPDGREPWGLTVPDGLAQGGPSDRALRWVAHIYRYGYAVEYNPTKAVEQSLKIPRSTAGRWIAAARAAGHLEPAEGTGKAGG